MLLIIHEDKFYFHLDLNENIDDFKGIVYNIHDNLYEKDPIVNINLKKDGCSQDFETITLFFWPGTFHFNINNKTIDETSNKNFVIYDSKYVCV
jgi:hypothetical protein